MQCPEWFVNGVVLIHVQRALKENCKLNLGTNDLYHCLINGFPVKKP